MACVTTGNQATLTFGSVTDIGRLRNIGFYNENGSGIDNSDLSSKSVKMCPGDLVDYGQIDATILWDTVARAAWMSGDADVHTVGTLTITFSDNTQIIGEAFVLSRNVGDHVNNQEVTENISFMWTADTGKEPTMSILP